MNLPWTPHGSSVRNDKAVAVSRILGVALGFAVASAPFVRGAASATGPGPPEPQDKAQPPASRATTVATRPSPRPTPAAALEGSVQGPDGRTIEGALVLYRPLAASFRERADATRTDAHGHFHAALKTAGAVYVRVTAKGLAGRTFEKVQPGSPLAVVLDRGGTIDGFVRDGTGQPLGGARVTATSDLGMAVSGWETDKESIEATTDARGHFRLDGIGPGLSSLSATAHGFGSARKGNVRPGSTVTLIARPGGWLAGQVNDPQGRPVQGALVRAEMEPQPGGSSAVETTDAGGRFEVTGLDVGTYSVVARHADFAPGVATGVAVDVEGRADLSVVLAVGAAITGRLVDAEERPLDGRVAAQELAGQPMARSLAELLRADAGADGRFRIEKVPPGSYGLGAVAAGHAGRRIDVEVSSRQAVIDLGDIALERGLAIRGRVRTSSGAPVPDAQITTGGFDIWGATFSETRSDADGSFVLAGVTPAPTRVSVRATGFASVNKTMTPGADPVDLILTAGASVTGIVVEDGDRPLDAYRIVANPVDHASRGEGTAEKSVGSTDGRFLLEDLAEGTYVLQVLVPDRAPATLSGVRVSAGRTTDAGIIRVPRGGVVRGTVTDTAGAAVVGATVKAYAPTQDAMEWSEQFQTLSEPSGAFEIRGVPDGTRQIVAKHPEYSAADVMVEVVASKGPTEARLVLTLGGRIEGVARKRDGTPLAGLSINVHSQSNRLSRGWGPNSVTGADGRFTVEHVAPGPTLVTLMANVGPGQMTSLVSKQVEVREGETAFADLSSREILVSGRVVKSGTPLPGLRLRFMGEGGMTTVVMGGVDAVAGEPTGPQHNVGSTGEDGTFALIVDTPGKYWVMTESQDGRTTYPSREAQIPDVDAHSLEIAFSGVPVTGIVVDKETDQPVPQALVSGAPNDKDVRRASSAQARTGADGRFQLDADPGEYTLSARAEGYGIGSLAATVGASGLSDARIELEKGLEIKGRVLDATGHGVPGVRVQARAGESEYGGSPTLPDATFRISGLAAHPYNLCAGNQLAGYAVRIGVAPGGADVTLTLRPAARVLLLVKGPEGTPLPKAYASVTKVGGAVVDVPFLGGRGPSDAKGLIEIPTPAGALEIEVRADKYEGTARTSVAEGATATSEVTLTASVDTPK
jgi:carboxypeptidase family protein